MPHTKGLAERALTENLNRLRENKPDPLNLNPLNFNVHVALVQMALMLEDLHERQGGHDERLAALERALGSRRRKSYGGGSPAPARGS